MLAAVEAGLSHGLKKRAGGLLPAHDTQTILTKLAKVSQPAADLVKKLTGEDEHGKQNGNTSPSGGLWRFEFSYHWLLAFLIQTYRQKLTQNCAITVTHSFGNRA